MKAVLDNSANNFSLKQIRKSHLAKVLVFPSILLMMFWFGYLDVIALVHSQIFYGISVVKRYSKDNYFIQISSFVLVLILGILLLKHQILGFGNYPIIGQQVSRDGAPYSFWFNKDSIIVGLSLVIAFYKYKPFTIKDFVRILYASVFSVIILSSVAIVTGLVRFDIKYVSFFKVWFLFNIMTVIVEEAFYRLFLLESIVRLYRGKYNVTIGAVIVSIIFASMHYFYSNFTYVLLAFIGSLIYSYVYIMCRSRLEASVFCHLMVNVVHMIFFTYPFLNVV